MRPIALLLLFASTAAQARETAGADTDLERRLELAAVHGVAFALATGAPLPRATLCIRPGAPCAGPPPGWDVNWGSSPEEVVPLALPVAAGRPVLTTRDGAPLVLVDTRAKVVTIALDTTSLRRWPYFNYVLHAAACEAAGQAPPRFAAWEGAPLPGPTTRRWLFVGLVALWALAGVLFRRARRLGRDRPYAARAFFSSVAAAARARGGGGATRAGWERIGFARPLAGLLTILGMMAAITGGYLALQWILSKRIQPFPEADGLWRSLYDMLWVVWLLFDLGTQTAAVKYFAQHRVSRIEDALADLQFYVWWQLFSRLAQATILASVALDVLPYSDYAIYAPFLAFYALIFTPGLNVLPRVVCSALQRFDYQNLLDIGQSRVLTYVVPIPFVLLGRAWGAEHSRYGEAFGAALGLAAGQMATHLVVMTLGFWVLRRLGVPIATLFLAQFDRQVVRRQLVYGAKITLGQEPYKIAAMVESLVIIKSMHDFTAWQGIRDLLCLRLATLNWFSLFFYMSGIAAFSEAYSAGMKSLTQYYVARFWQFGHIFAATVFSLMIAVGPTFIGTLGPTWSRATPFVTLALLQGLMLPMAWTSDALQQGAGKPMTYAFTMTLEHGLHVVLTLVLVPRYHFAGILLANVLSTAVKVVVAWAINHKTIVPLRIQVLPTFVPPLVAGIANFALWRGLIAVWTPTGTVDCLALLCLASTASFLVTLFVCGLAGAFDEIALADLSRASEMTAGFVRPLCRLLGRAAQLGASLSPLRPKPPALASEALAEAEGLERRAALAWRGRENPG